MDNDPKLDLIWAPSKEELARMDRFIGPHLDMVLFGWNFYRKQYFGYIPEPDSWLKRRVKNTLAL